MMDIEEILKALNANASQGRKASAIHRVISNDLRWHVEHGDSLVVLKSMPDACVDAIVTDPPAGIGFMGKEFDSNRGGRGRWIAWLSERLAECYRVTKPGGRMLCWSIPRTTHWTGCAIEDAGWEIENTIAHLFGSGFPKAKTQLKPAREDWWLARKPAKNVLPLNIDACRIGTSGGTAKVTFTNEDTVSAYGNGLNGNCEINRDIGAGRWTANLALSHAIGCKGVCVAGCPIAELDRQSGDRKGSPVEWKSNGQRNGVSMNAAHDGSLTTPAVYQGYGDSGGASRFFNTFEADTDDIDTALFVYQAKASRADRNAGDATNTHPTVKSTPLMRHLVKLIAKPGDVVLDAFCGSGSTGRGAVLEGCRFIGIEREDTEAEPYVTIARRRIADATKTQ